jgi:hypothetical protein
MEARYHEARAQQKAQAGPGTPAAGSPDPIADSDAYSETEPSGESMSWQDAKADRALLNDPNFRSFLNVNLPSTRTEKEIYPIAPREIMNFFLCKDIYLIAKDAQQSLITKVPRATDVRNFLRQSLFVAYEAMATRTDRSGAATPPLNNPVLMGNILEAVRERKFGHVSTNQLEPLRDLFNELVRELEAMRDHMDAKHPALHQPMGSLCWAIAVDAALLDFALHTEMPKVLQAQGIAFCPPPEMHFYFQDDVPDDGRHAVFNDFVKYKWPVITFALDPVTDQQNVADSFNLKRDLQLAVSYAFATG